MPISIIIAITSKHIGRGGKTCCRALGGAMANEQLRPMQFEPAANSALANFSLKTRITTLAGCLLRNKHRLDVYLVITSAPRTLVGALMKEPI